MQKVYSLLYNLCVIPLLFIFFHLAKYFNPKIKKGVAGRKKLFQILEQKVTGFSRNHPRVWIHAASVGEFEQARPLIDALINQVPHIQIIQSFFSPSAYEKISEVPGIQCITYMPFDSKKNATRFLNILQPDLAIFVRWDLWPNHLWTLRKKTVPAFLINASLYDRSLRNKSLLRGFNLCLFQGFEKIFVVSEEQKARFKQLGLDENLIVSGDTRCDQVWQRSQEKLAEETRLRTLFRDKLVFIAGSTWEDDELHLIPGLSELIRRNPEFLCILVPHEPTPKNMQRLGNLLNKWQLKYIFYSELMEQSTLEVPCILVDGVGILANLYKFAHIAFVGGGFGQGIHNVLEPAVYGVPVLFGPQIAKSWEAQELLRSGAVIQIHSGKQFIAEINKLLNNQAKRKEIGRRAKSWILSDRGATEIILKEILNYIESG